ncbi:AAA family ATPase [Rathayibacter soli]|uniref:AAA family ATPase n=1 Tax=Rathayibacter soli TaxID=3144168 RepID=UPI0027E4E6EB|nr:AAA family ATPase [Glaciibacter superstes]
MGTLAGVLVGRESELERLFAASSEAETAGPALVFVEGEAGMGKTSLLNALVADSGEHMRMLRVAGEASEQILEYGVVEQLHQQLKLRPEADRPPGLGAVLLEGIRSAADRRPLALIFDDAQWFDRASVQTLSYLIRRLSNVPVLIVVASRPSASWLAPIQRAAAQHRYRKILLDGLPVPAVRQLASTGGVTLSQRAAERLWRHTGGSPQLCRALIEELDPEEFSRGDGALPAPSSYAALVADHFAGCDEQVRSVVAASAVFGSAAPLASLAYLAEVEGIPAAVDVAIKRGLLTRRSRGGSWRIDVPHALVRSAVLDALPLATSIRLHSRAAELSPEPVQAMLHRLRAVPGHDPDVAAQAISLARSRQTDGQALARAQLLTGAAELLPPGTERTIALVQAADILLALGEARWAAAILGTVGAERPGEMDAHELLVRGHLAVQLGDATGPELIAQAWKAGESPQVTVGAAELLAFGALDVGDGEATGSWARRAIQAAAPGTANLGCAGTMLAASWVLRGNLDAGREELEPQLQRFAGTGSEADVLLGLALLDIWDGRFDAAEHTLARLAGLVDRGPAMVRAITALARAEHHYRVGEWDASLEVIEASMAALDEGWESRTAPMVLTVGSFVQAGRGEWDAARDSLSQAESMMSGPGHFTARMWVAIGRARLAVAANDAVVVVEELSPLLAMLEGAALCEGYQPWRTDLAEALVAVGQLGEADEILGLGRARMRCGGAHVRVGILRAEALLAAARGDEAAAVARFDDALAVDPSVTGRFMFARTAFAAGAFERRRGQRRRAVQRLKDALEIFDAVGAVPFANRARSELELCGLQRGTAARKGATVLTPAERSVAGLVVKGHTNREVAAQLSISVKTVETHLTRTFAKFDIRGRVELVAALRGDSDLDA